MRTFLAGLGVIVSLSAMYVGCGLMTRGEQADGFVPTGSSGNPTGGGGGAGAGPSCASQDDCPKDSDCASYLCKDAHCQLTLLPAGTEVQNGKIVGDCKKIVCTAAGTTTLQNADDDAPASPDTCTTKTCGGGEVISTPQVDNTSCGVGLFCKSGVCVGCKLPADCPVPTECQSVDCQNMACVYANKPDGTLAGDNSVTDDCVHTICIAGVKNVDVPDPTEIPPTDGTICTDDTCDINGQPKYIAAMEGVVCGPPSGVCFVDSVCKTGTCAEQYQTAGFLLSDANPGNCKREACDGLGNITQVNYDDKPGDMTLTDCKTPACQGGMSTQVNVSNGAACTGAAASTCCGGTCCGGAASVCFGANGNSCCDSGKLCGANCCNTDMAACAGANGSTCCESGKTCGTNCCVSGLAECSGAQLDACCEVGKVCGTSCCLSASAACSGAGGVNCCESGKTCSTTCCTSAGASCYGAGGATCCETGKTCGPNCCPNATDGCVTGNMCCAANKVCNGGTVCCGGAMVCMGGTTCG